MQTDSLFYRFFQLYPALLFELLVLPREMADHYQFSSVELKQLAFRIDGLFLPTRVGDPTFFVEVQFQRDVKFYARLFGEIFLYLSRHQVEGDWQAVVIFPSAWVDVCQNTHYRELLSSGRVQRIYLDQLSGESFGVRVLKFMVSPSDVAVRQVGLLLDQSEQQFQDAGLRQQMVSFLETLVVYKFPHMSREEIGKMFSTQDLRKTRFYQEVVQEGIQQGEAEFALRLLHRKVGILPENVTAEIRSLSTEQLEELAEALLEFERLENLTAWLSQRGTSELG
ncbi:MAG: Rpn family recombination-promoting nuclease/putative transposase [Cyanobacteriota bacterium]